MSFADERDLKLLDNDKYTFFVLRRIIGNECRLLITDHEKLIICYSGEPFPVCVRILAGIFVISSALTIVLFLIRGRKEHEGRSDLYHWMEERGFA